MLRGHGIVNKLCASCLQNAPLSRFSSNNPGAKHRLKITDDFKIDDLDDLDYEANFESLGTSHKQHMKELKAMKEKLQYDIVKQKYFKQKYPNFLTWHDKEQIKQLHEKDPEEWNVIKLSEGFPALPDVIRKIIKSKWRMENAERMKKHDELVQDNWRKLKNNEYKELPSELIAHLMKFSNRKFNFHNYDDVVDYSNIEYKPKLKSTEFSDIITSYDELKKNKSPAAIESKDAKNNIQNLTSMESINKMKKSEEEDTHITGTIKNKQHMTLSTLRKHLQEKSAGKLLSIEDMSIIELQEKEVVKETPVSRIDQLDYTKYNTGKMMKLDEKKVIDYNHLIYPEHIKIPKKFLKRGQTYKLNDCFYDSDGTFLYRVPGM